MLAIIIVTLMLLLMVSLCAYYLSSLLNPKKDKKPDTILSILCGFFSLLFFILLIIVISVELNNKKAEHYTESDLVFGHVYCQRTDVVKVDDDKYFVLIDNGLEVQDYCLETPPPPAEYFIFIENGNFPAATREDFKNSIHPNRAIPLPWEGETHKFGREVITETVEDFAPVRKEKSLNDLDQVIKELPSDGEGSK